MPQAPAELEARDAMRDWQQSVGQPCCGNCRFWRSGYRATGGQWVENRTYHGRCQARAPTAPAAEDGDAWPYTHQDDWCGEHEESKP